MTQTGSGHPGTGTRYAGTLYRVPRYQVPGTGYNCSYRTRVQLYSGLGTYDCIVSIANTSNIVGVGTIVLELVLVLVLVLVLESVLPVVLVFISTVIAVPTIVLVVGLRLNGSRYNCTQVCIWVCICIFLPSGCYKIVTRVQFVSRILFVLRLFTIIPLCIPVVSVSVPP